MNFLCELSINVFHDMTAMESSIMSQQSGYGYNVSVQDPLTAKILSEDKYGPKPEFEKGQYVYISKIKTLGGELEFMRRIVLTHQCCTHYVMFFKDQSEDPQVMPNLNGYTFWYLIQNPKDALDIDWVKERDLQKQFEEATKYFDDLSKSGVASHLLDPQNSIAVDNPSSISANNPYLTNQIRI